MINNVFSKHSTLIGASKEGPTIIKEQYMDLYPVFLDTKTATEIKTLFKKTYDDLIQILFVSMMLTRTSTPFRSGKKYEPSLFSIDCLQSLSKHFTQSFRSELKRKRIDVFDQKQRYVHIGPKCLSKLLNSLIFPRITMIQLLHARDMDKTLNALRGYMYKDFPREFGRPKVNLALDTLHNSPIYQWHFYGDFDGFKVYMRRVREDYLAMRIEFDVPFILPLGKYTESSMRALVKKQIKTFSFGV